MQKLSQLIRGDDLIVAPVALNPIMARLAAEAGFKAIYMSGGSLGWYKCVTEANITLPEMAQIALDMRAACKLPIVLDAAAIDLAPIVVEAGIIDLWRDLAGFYERRRQYKGYARFYTREDIERQRAGRISTLLKGAGISQWCMRAYTCVPTRFVRGRMCAVPISVNGLPVWESDFDRIPIDMVAAVEVWRDPNPQGFSTPAAQLGQYSFEARDPVYGRERCGSVGIWTR